MPLNTSGYSPTSSSFYTSGHTFHHGRVFYSDWRRYRFCYSEPSRQFAFASTISIIVVRLGMRDDAISQNSQPIPLLLHQRALHYCCSYQLRRPSILCISWRFTILPQTYPRSAGLIIASILAIIAEISHISQRHTSHPNYNTPPILTLGSLYA